jgi:hypothetical protein
MNDPMAVLADAFRNEWADPLSSAAVVVEALRSLARSDWDVALPQVQRFRRERADSALLLSVTDPAVDPEVGRVLEGLDDVERRLLDSTWIRRVARRLEDAQTVGVVSLGDFTLTVLELALLSGDPDLVTDKLAVARGLGYLNANIEIGPPETAEVVLVPAAARFGTRIWTTTRIAHIVDAAGQGATHIVPLIHPLYVLSPLARGVYRPAHILIDVELPQSRSTT